MGNTFFTTLSKVMRHLGHGPAATGWAEHAAHGWHQRLQKLTLALADEKEKYYKDLQQQDEKIKGNGAKALEAMQKKIKVAEMRVKRDQILTDMQKEAMRFLKEGGTIQEDELGEEYQSEILRISLNEVGVCPKCRHQSGCYKCDKWKCLRYFMRQAHKRTGKPIEKQFQWGRPSAEKRSNEQHGSSDFIFWNHGSSDWFLREMGAVKGFWQHGNSDGFLVL